MTFRIRTPDCIHMNDPATVTFSHGRLGIYTAERLATRRNLKTAMGRPCSRAGDSAPRPTWRSRTRRPLPLRTGPHGIGACRAQRAGPASSDRLGLAGGARHGNHAHRRVAQRASPWPPQGPGPARCPVDLRRLGPWASSPTTVDVRTQEAIEVRAREFEFKLSCETRPLGPEPHGRRLVSVPPR